MYIGYDPTAHHVGLVDDLIFASIDVAEVVAVPVLQRVLGFPGFVPKAQVHSVLVQAREVLLVILQSHDLILPLYVSIYCDFDIQKDWGLPSSRFFSERDFLRVIGSGCSTSSSSSGCSPGSLVSLSF